MSGGKKFDEGKLPYELISTVALDEIVKVLGFGAEKYGRHNWRQGMRWSRLHGAALRHLTKHLNGESLDEETNISHLAHAACCLMFLLEYELTGKGQDDRYKETP